MRSRRSSSICATSDARGSRPSARATRTRTTARRPTTMAAVLPPCCRGRAARRAPADRRRRTGAGGARASTRWTPRSRHHGAAKCALDIALHDLVGKRSRPARPRAPRPVGGHPADRLHDRHRRARGRRRARQPGEPVPGAQDQARRSGRPRDPRGRPRRLRRPDPGRRQHGLDARPGEASPARPDRLGVELIEQPFPARSLDRAGRPPGATRRCRSSPTRAR